MSQLTKSNMSQLLHLQRNVNAHLHITGKRRAGVEVPLQAEAAQAPLKEKGNTGVTNAVKPSCFTASQL